jgi:hypothetical protein
MKRTLALSFAVLLASPALASAQVEEEIPAPPLRSSSGEASLLSARTLGVGETMVAGAAGWPWIWAHLELAPTSTFNLGIRLALLYGSSMMALEPGVGSELSVPTRIHLHSDDNVDIGVFVTPAIFVGQGSIAGEGSTAFSGDVGWGSRLEAGGNFAVRVIERLTIFVGVGGHFGFVHTPAAGGPEAVGAAFASFGVEGLISRDTMLFAQADGGIGIAPSRGGQALYRMTVPPFLRVSLGVAYLL